MAEPFVIEYKERTQTYLDGSSYTYKTIFLDSVWYYEVESTVANLARVTATLEQLSEENEEHRGDLEDIAATMAEDLEVEFVYQIDGRERKYTPQAFWEPSGGCEWEESAQYGYDYGWDI